MKDCCANLIFLIRAIAEKYLQIMLQYAEKKIYSKHDMKKKER